jgi:hypothetical protein
MGYFFTIKCIRIGIINQQSEAIKGTKKANLRNKSRRHLQIEAKFKLKRKIIVKNVGFARDGKLCTCRTHKISSSQPYPKSAPIRSHDMDSGY